VTGQVAMGFPASLAIATKTEPQERDEDNEVPPLRSESSVFAGGANLVV
jgi:hypothetical protein